jgi:hypothetical protein
VPDDLWHSLTIPETKFITPHVSCFVPASEPNLKIRSALKQRVLERRVSPLMKPVDKLLSSSSASRRGSHNPSRPSNHCVSVLSSQKLLIFFEKNSSKKLVCLSDASNAAVVCLFYQNFFAFFRFFYKINISRMVQIDQIN